MIQINYVTSSEFKKHELEVFFKNCILSDNTPVSQVFDYKVYPNKIHERLEVDIEKMVIHEVKEAYSYIKIPCIVEHAGLIFNKYKKSNYPGGLTKPLWDTLGENFLVETNSANLEVTARAVIAFCDGRTIKTFVGETNGILAIKPKGERKFYWDTIFIPDPELGLTYAEIVEQKGLAEKILKYSQSAKALIKLMDFLRKNNGHDFWS